MPEREKVINGLEREVARTDLEWLDYVEVELLQDALTLLKAQEPIAPVKVNRYMEIDENGDWFTPETYDCGNCGVELHGKANYCHLCGRAVKWE
jgi:hypothetical protein